MDWLEPVYLTLIAGAIVAASLFAWSWIRRRQLIQRLGDPTLIDQLARSVIPGRRLWKAAMVTVAVALMGVALAGPRFGTKLREVKREGVDLVVALDVSLSMQARDVAPNRLDRAKNEIKKLLDELRGDRVGLVLFAGDAFIQCPLTTDYGAVRLFLDVANPKLIPTPGTDFGTALQRAIQAFETGGDIDAAEERTRVLLFISDGENHVADVQTVLQEARDAGILMFAAGVGEPEGSPIPLADSNRNREYKKDRQGRTVTSRLEEEVLQELSSDGAYFRIARTSSSLSKIITSLERLERTEYGTEEFEEYDEKFQWPLAVACLLLLGECFVSDKKAVS